MKTVVLHGRKVVGGVVEGEALVTTEMVSGWGGINPADGKIIDVRHELHGQSVKGKILVFPGAKGSSGWSSLFHYTRRNGNAPSGLIFNVMNTKAALGSVVIHAPAVTGLNQNPLEIIQSGDWVKIDADQGIVEVTKK
ncbi:aconitase X swivel domain-containing protein [Pelosinus propionicus]|uniref:Predicted aconitase subunit 2 n=1 Tax=Pelosinus propionicus DSM 13327 TaxID=1123291 RepID=A0A1I4IKI8_9FIRM|nr:DUF126 domain-containing protein [Pelosinus propionicus]SFL54919.1 predicted aconitase subunit 2 [Pelosinus propionicus DSM 13327]